MARKYPEGFYVYIHIRESDGLVFYVGKGTHNREWQHGGTQRSLWWIRVKEKHGIKVFIVKRCIDNDHASEVEKILIYGFRQLGHPLVNMTDGGEGRFGWRSPDNKPIFSSLGERFECITDALEYLRVNGHRNCSDGGIYSCLNGNQRSSYDRAWSYSGFPDHPTMTGREANLYSCMSSNMKKVVSSRGEVFISASEAARNLSSNGYPRASQGRVSCAARGESGSAYGRSWWYEGDEPREYIDYRKTQGDRQKIPVIMDGFIRHDSLKDAAEWLVDNGHERAKHSDISVVLSGRRKSCYGHTWKYADE